MWVLIVTFVTGWDSGYEYAIPNLPSYSECVRVSKLILVPQYSSSGPTFKCIEVVK